MKRIILSILAVAALASCSKTESAYVDQDQEIRLNPVTAMTTKAYSPVSGAIDGTTYPTTENFGVVAYWANEPAGEKFGEKFDEKFDENVTTYLGAQGAVEFTNKGLYWGGTTTYYWPKTGSLRFAAYSPYRIGNTKVSHNIVGDIYTIDFEQSTEGANTVDLLVAPTSESYTAETAAEKVSVVFEHTQSWITLKVKATEAADGAFTLKNLTINNLYKAGTLTADMLKGEQKWEYTGEPNNTFVVFDGSQDVVTKVATAENVKEQNGTLVLPQATTSVTVTFDQKAEGNIPALTDQVLEIPLVLDTEHTPWEAGKHYIYTLIFDRDEILINPTVADWEEVYVNDVPATDNEVATAEEFAAAVNNSSQIRLVDDIELTTNFHLNSSLNIDLNGHTLTTVRPVDDNESRILFRVNSGATLTIGRGTVNSAGYIASANAGGTIIVNNGTYTTADATIFQANGGKVYVTGGKFNVEGTNATYLLNHIDGQKNTGLIEVSGGTFVNYNPAESTSENPAMNFVKAGCNVISVENGANTEYTVTGAGEAVTLSADAVVYGSVKVTDNVFDGAGNTLSAAEVPSNNGMIRPAGNVTVKNVKIDGNNLSWNDNGTERGLRGLYINDGGNYVFDKVEVYNVTYAINVNTTKTVTLNVSNSILEGWSSYGSSTTASFSIVTFKVNPTSGVGYFRPYGNTVLSNCSFDNGFKVDFSELVKNSTTIKFDKCKYNGTLITAENIQTLGFIENYDATVVVF